MLLASVTFIKTSQEFFFFFFYQFHGCRMLDYYIVRFILYFPRIVICIFLQL